MDIEVMAYVNTNEVVNSWYEGVDTSLRGHIGLVAHRGDEMIASGFLVPTYSSFCIYEFLQTNPKCSSFTRAKAVRILAKTAVHWAKDHGYAVLMGFVEPNRKDLQKEYQRQGAHVSEKSFYQVTRRL
jgi:hypothetical protein